MKDNVTFPIGNIVLIDKIDSESGFFKSVFNGIAGRAKTFVPITKLLISNRLGQCHSVNRLLQFTPIELIDILGFDGKISNRSVYRTLERIGAKHSFIISNYQNWAKKQKLIDQHQMIDFTSGYFEGKKCSLGEFGYSRDGQPGKLQFTLGISVGINEIPTALTIQKGNVPDKEHMKMMLRLCSKVLYKNSLLIFDCGGNTKKNKETIRGLGFHYLTLKGKKKTPYRHAITVFQMGQKTAIESNGRNYFCVKTNKNNEFQYIFFSEKLKEDQVKKKVKKFQKALEKGAVLEKKVQKGKELGQHICPNGWIVTTGQLQKTIDKISNPFITGIEGFFILESSLDAEPEKILQLYKDRDKAEKFIRDLKEGAELRPIRHWSKEAVIGAIIIAFLTNVVVNLTHFLSKSSLVKNLKLLKKYLNNLTLSILYPKNSFRIAVISNFSAEMRALFGDFIRKYGEIELKTSW